jgi:hypothetical protein
VGVDQAGHKHAIAQVDQFRIAGLSPKLISRTDGQDFCIDENGPIGQ